MRLIRFFLILFLIFLLHPYLAFSQTSLKITVLDKALKIPIQYASVYCKQKHIGLYTDQNGLFEVPRELSIGDTLTIANVGYKTENITIDQLKPIIDLESTATTLNEVAIVPKGTEVSLGAQKQQTHFVQDINQITLRNEIAFLITNDKKYNGKLTSVSIYISPSGKPKTPFRLRLYTIENQKPSQDILTKNLVVQGSGKGGWIEVDLKNFNIPINGSGLFVSVESLYGLKKSSFYEVKNVSTGKKEMKYGQSLGLTDEFETAIAYQRKFNDKWLPFSVRFPSHISTATFYPMMKIKIRLDD